MRAFQQLAIPREQAEGSGLFLQGSQACGKLAKVVPYLAHARLAAVRLA
jgi:hypothetical protein